MTNDNFNNQEWTNTNKIFLRITFIYIFLYIVPYGFEYIYAVDVLDADGFSIWTKIVPWFGETFLGASYNVDRLWSGFDSKFDYTRFLFIAILALLFSIAWLFIDKKYKFNYDIKLNSLLRAMLRYHVAFTLILYGMVKVIPLQFGDMGIDRLEGKIGDYSPMGFLWVFMSYSKFYTSTTGFVEVFGGLLLLFRPTVLIGALICFVAMANVVLIDIGYDVSVKLFAIHLFLMVLYLLKDDIRKIIDFLVLRKQAQTKIYPPLITNEKYVKLGFVLKYGLIIYIIVTTGFELKERLRNQYDTSNLSFRKYYQVEQFILNGDTLPPLMTDSIRWQSFTIGGNSYRLNNMNVSIMNKKRKRFQFEIDSTNKKIEFFSLIDSTDRYIMNYMNDKPEEFILSGIHNNDTLWIKTNPKSKEEYRLTKYGIRWIRDL